MKEERDLSRAPTLAVLCDALSRVVWVGSSFSRQHASSPRAAHLFIGSNHY